MIRLRGRGRRVYLPLLAAAFLAVWIAGTVVAIAAGGERGAESPQDLFARGSAALEAADPAAFDGLLLDGPDEAFARDYLERLTAAGRPALSGTGADGAEIRSGRLALTLSVVRDQGRWYLSLLPPTG